MKVQESWTRRNDVELDGFCRCEVDDLEFLGFGEAVGCEVFDELGDGRWGLRQRGLIVR